MIYRPPPDPNSNTVLPGVRHPSSRAAQRRRQRATAPVLRVRRTYLHVPAVARARRSCGVADGCRRCRSSRQWRRAGRPMHVRVFTATSRADDVRARTRHLHPPIPRALGEHAHVDVSVLRSYGRRLGRSSRCRTDAGRGGQVVPTQAFLAAAGYHELPVRRACSSGGAGAHRRKLRAARRRGGGVRRAGDGGVAWQPSGRASAREPWKLLLPTIQIDPGHTSARSNDRERPRGGRYFIYRPPPESGSGVPRRSRTRPGAPVPVLHVPALSPPVGVPLACSGEPLPLCRGYAARRARASRGTLGLGDGDGVGVGGALRRGRRIDGRG